MVEEPFQTFIDQLAELLKFAELNSAKNLEGPVDPEIEKRLENLETLVGHFKKLANTQILASGVSIEETLRKFRESPEKFSPHEQKILRDLANLGVNTVILRAGLARARKNAGKNRQREVGKNTQKSIQKRRRKFRGFREDKDWRKL